MFGCSWKNCKLQLMSQGLLRAHINEDNLVHKCNACDEKFMDEGGIKEHKVSQHEEKEWNYYKFSFQANSSKELMNHLKVTGHQLSHEIQNLWRLMLVHINLPHPLLEINVMFVKKHLLTLKSHKKNERQQ